MARWDARLAPGHPRVAGKDLADRDLLSQGRDAAQSIANAGATGQRLQPDRRCEAEAAGIHQRLLRVADQFQPALRERRRSIQGDGRRLRWTAERLTERTANEPCFDIRWPRWPIGRRKSCARFQTALPVIASDLILARRSNSSGISPT